MPPLTATGLRRTGKVCNHKSNDLPNKTTHLIAGLLTGTGVALARMHFVEGPNLFTVDTGVERTSLAVILLLSAAVGGQAGLLPDILESAKRKKWHHRRFFHSYTVLVLLLLLIYRVEASADALGVVAHFLTVGAAGYLSHLLLDSRTTKGLPVV